jgi:hypothetical protein
LSGSLPRRQCVRRSDPKLPRLPASRKLHHRYTGQRSLEVYDFAALIAGNTAQPH